MQFLSEMPDEKIILNTNLPLQLKIYDAQDFHYYDHYITHCGQNIAILDKTLPCYVGALKVFSKRHASEYVKKIVIEAEPTSEFYIDLLPRTLIVSKSETLAVVYGRNEFDSLLVLYEMDLCRKNKRLVKQSWCVTEYAENTIDVYSLSDDNLVFFDKEGHMNLYNICGMQLTFSRTYSLQPLPGYLGEVISVFRLAGGQILFFTNYSIAFEYNFDNELFTKVAIFDDMIGIDKAISFTTFDRYLESEAEFYAVYSKGHKFVRFLNKTKGGTFEITNEYLLENISNPIVSSGGDDIIVSTDLCGIILKDKWWNFVGVLCLHHSSSEMDSFAFDLSEIYYRCNEIMVIDNLRNGEIIFLNPLNGLCHGFKKPLRTFSLKSICKQLANMLYSREMIASIDIPRQLKGYLLS